MRQAKFLPHNVGRFLQITLFDICTSILHVIGAKVVQKNYEMKKQFKVTQLLCNYESCWNQFTEVFNLDCATWLNWEIVGGAKNLNNKKRMILYIYLFMEGWKRRWTGGMR